MKLIVVLRFEQSEAYTGSIAVIHRRSSGSSYDWIFSKFRPNGTEGLTVGSTEQLSTLFIETVVQAGCGEVFIQQEDFSELALKAQRASTFQSDKHQIDLSRITETITVPSL